MSVASQLAALRAKLNGDPAPPHPAAGPPTHPATAPAPAPTAAPTTAAAATRPSAPSSAATALASPAHLVPGTGAYMYATARAKAAQDLREQQDAHARALEVRKQPQYLPAGRGNLSGARG